MYRSLVTLSVGFLISIQVSHVYCMEAQKEKNKVATTKQADPLSDELSPGLYVLGLLKKLTSLSASAKINKVESSLLKLFVDSRGLQNALRNLHKPQFVPQRFKGLQALEIVRKLRTLHEQMQHLAPKLPLERLDFISKVADEQALQEHRSTSDAKLGAVYSSVRYRCSDKGICKTPDIIISHYII